MAQCHNSAMEFLIVRSDYFATRLENPCAMQPFLWSDVEFSLSSSGLGTATGNVAGPETATAGVVMARGNPTLTLGGESSNAV
jgi:hypothetical protein